MVGTTGTVRTVDTAYGRVRGVERNGVWTFSGVPYAASPAGPRRWTPPVAPDPWTGVRDCSVFGPSAPQLPPIPGMSVAGESTEHSEDCLSLNVWTPGPDGSGRRPVMVWLHGGGFTSGAGSGNFYRGGVLARRGDVVVVTVNYRLGALGYLAHPALSVDRDGPWLGGSGWSGFGNWGLADQIAALAWVRDNIVGFGGDPGNVTLFGESAGGMSVSTLLGAPAAHGLFRRAVVQSGPPYVHTAEQGAEAAERICHELGVPVERPALLGVEPERLVRAVQTVAGRLRFERDRGLPLALLPVIDGGLLARHPFDAVADGTAAASWIALLIGTNRDEAAFFGAMDPAITGLDDAGLLRWVRRAVHSDERARALIGAVREVRAARGEPVAPKDLWEGLATETIFRLPSVRLADAHAAASGDDGPGARVYLFTWETPAFGGVFGACHALEIPFVFGTVRNPSVQLFTGGGDRAAALSRAMVDAWLGFAGAGVPGGGDLGQWPPWDPEVRPTAVFGPWPGDDAVARIVHRPRDEELVALVRALDRD